MSRFVPYLLAVLPLASANPLPQASSVDAVAASTQFRSDIKQFLETQHDQNTINNETATSFFAAQKAKLDPSKFVGSRNTCAAWGSKLPSFYWCNEATSDIAIEPWPKGTIFGQKDDVTGQCAFGVHGCLPLYFAEGDCRITLDFWPDIDIKDRTDTAEWLDITDAAGWNMLECTAWRWDLDPWKV